MGQLGGALNLLTSVEAATYLRLKPATLQAKCVDGTGPVITRLVPASEPKSSTSPKISIRGWNSSVFDQHPNMANKHRHLPKYENCLEKS